MTSLAVEIGSGHVAIGECCRVVNGTTPPAGITEYWNGDVVWITPTDLGKLEAAYIHGSDRRISPRALDSHNLTLCPPGSVVLSSRAPIGHLGIAAVPLCTNQGCKTLVPRDCLKPEYLYYALLFAVPDLQALGSGATFAEVSKAQVAGFKIPLPPLAEQERIAARLTEQLAAVDRARAAARERLAAAQALPAAYLRDVFEGPEASGWDTRPLGELVHRHNEIIHPGDREDGESVFVGLEHIEAHTGRRIGSLMINLAKLAGRKPTFLRGQIVYGYLRPYLNKVWVADFDGCSSVDQFAFDVNHERADTAFVAAFMRSETFLRRAAGVTTTGQLPRISVDEIAAVEINLPTTVTDQRRIAAALSRRLAAAERLAGHLRDELAAIDALPAALLREAFGDG